MFDWLENILNWYMDNMNYMSILVCMTIESSIIPFPAELIIPPAAWKAAKGELDLILVVLSGTTGAVCGALTNYAIAYYLGRKFIYNFAKTKYGRWCMITREKVERAEHYFLQHGKSSTLVGRLTPGVRSFISIPAGLARMPLRSFIFYTFIGAGLWNTLLAGVGYFLFTQQETLHKYVTELSLVTLIAGGIFFAYIFTRKKIKT